MGPLTHARMTATPAVVLVVDTTSLEVQRDGQVPPGTAVDAPVVGHTSSGVQRGGQVPQEHVVRVRSVLFVVKRCFQ